jgi:hypothetical protein
MQGDSEATSQTIDAVFYNVYMVSETSEELLQEQMKQIQDALATNNSSKNNKTVLYYNVIGYNYTKSICDNDGALICKRLEYYKQAHEEVTLQPLHEYCQRHPDHRVSYLHTKGSFHPTQANKVSRRVGTRAVLSRACQSMQDASPCNICSLWFQTYPVPIIPGNFFTADCSYVQNLVPPMGYEQQRRNLCKVVNQVYPNGTDTTFCPTNEEADNLTQSVDYGFGRYAMERWIVSHPDLRPCDTLPKQSLREYRRFDTGFDPFVPTLHRSEKKSKRIAPEMKNSLALLTHEFMYLYGTKRPREDGFCDYYFTKNNPCKNPPVAFAKAVLLSRD